MGRDHLHRTPSDPLRASIASPSRDPVDRCLGRSRHLRDDVRHRPQVLVVDDFSRTVGVTCTSSRNGTRRPWSPCTVTSSRPSRLDRWARSRRSTSGTGSRASGSWSRPGLGAVKRDAKSAHHDLGGHAGAHRLLTVHLDVQPAARALRRTSRCPHAGVLSKTALTCLARSTAARGPARRSPPRGSRAPAVRAAPP